MIVFLQCHYIFLSLSVCLSVCREKQRLSINIVVEPAEVKKEEIVNGDDAYIMKIWRSWISYLVMYKLGLPNIKKKNYRETVPTEVEKEGKDNDDDTMKT